LFLRKIFLKKGKKRKRSKKKNKAKKGKVKEKEKYKRKRNFLIFEILNSSYFRISTQEKKT
jgi:hypothetical protein